jgi:hypothetical protein
MLHRAHQHLDAVGAMAGRPRPSRAQPHVGPPGAAPWTRRPEPARRHARSVRWSDLSPSPPRKPECAGRRTPGLNVRSARASRPGGRNSADTSAAATPAAPHARRCHARIEIGEAACWHTAPPSGALATRARRVPPLRGRHDGMPAAPQARLGIEKRRQNGLAGACRAASITRRRPRALIGQHRFTSPARVDSGAHHGEAIVVGAGRGQQVHGSPHWLRGAG